VLKVSKRGVDSFEDHGLKEEGEAQSSFWRPRLYRGTHVDADHDLGCFHKVNHATTVSFLLVPTRLGSSSGRRGRRREEVRVTCKYIIEHPNVALRA